MTASDTTPPPPSTIHRLLRVTGLTTQVAVGVYPFTSTGLMAPLWAIVTGWLIWAGFAVAAWRVGRRRPQLTPLLPVASVATWFVFVAVGAEVFAWTP